MGDKNSKRIRLHHQQKDNKRERLLTKAESRQRNYELQRGSAQMEYFNNVKARAAFMFLWFAAIVGITIAYAEWLA